MSRRRKHHEPDVVVVEPVVIVVEEDATPVSVNPLDVLPEDVEGVPGQVTETDDGSAPLPPADDIFDDQYEQPGEAPADVIEGDPARGGMDAEAFEDAPADEDQPGEAPAEDETFFEEVTPDPVPMTVPAEVPGQPDTVYPDGVVPESPAVDYPENDQASEASPMPSPGVEPVYPTEPEVQEDVTEEEPVEDVAPVEPVTEPTEEPTE